MLVSVAMLTWYFREPMGGFLHSTQRGGLRIIAPLESGISRVLDPFKGAYEWMTGVISAQNENESLKAEADRLRNELIALRETSQENKRLKEMLGFTSQPSFPDDYRAQPARVIGRSGSSWSATITINRGSDDGVSLGQTVVNGQGLIGQISAVTTNSAQILLIIDHNSNVEAKLQSNSVMGTVAGSINGLLEMDFVEKDQQVSKNDVVVTSGSGRLFVKGVPIGVISEVSDQEIEYFKRISVTPFADFSRLEEVMVLIPPAGADQAPALPQGVQ